jgi:hypothetical protein
VIYWTIWLALVVFVAGQYGQRSRTTAGRVPRWVVWANATGITFCVVHIVVTMGSVHGWSHAAALEATARQTASVYGLRWGGGIYFNYLFVAGWAFDTWRLTRTNPRQQAPWLRHALRLFYFIVIVNAAVVFARPHMRVLGAGLVAVLVYAWRPTGPETHEARTAL